MTIEEISKTVSPGAPLARRQVYRYLDACGIKPLKPRKRPAQYPPDAAAVICKNLGIETPKSARIPSLAELRSERKKARGK